MNEYLSGLISISSMVGVCSFIFYGEREDKVLRVASSLIVVYVTVLPIVSLIGALDVEGVGGASLDSFLSHEETLIGGSAEEAFSVGVKRYVAERFSLSEDDISVRVTGFSYTSMRAEKIKIILSGKAVFADNRAIAEEISRSGLGECEVEIDVK